MNISEKSKIYAEGKALESITQAIAQAYEDGYRQGYMDCEAKMPKDLIGEDKVEYIDLGLPSGTLWGISDKLGKCYGEVKHLNLPTIDQLKELKDYTSLFFGVDVYKEYGDWKQQQNLTIRSIENGEELHLRPNCKIMSCTENDFHSIKGMITSDLFMEEGIIDKAEKVAVLVVK